MRRCQSTAYSRISFRNILPQFRQSVALRFLGYHLLTQQDRSEFEEFFAAATVLPISDLVVSKAIELRQMRKIKLGDALIAGTAMAHGLTLVTKDTQDFKWINGLTLLDPLGSQQSNERQGNDSNAV
jgi:predicted nucleic acid-binding protein